MARTLWEQLQLDDDDEEEKKLPKASNRKLRISLDHIQGLVEQPPSRSIEFQSFSKLKKKLFAKMREASSHNVDEKALLSSIAELRRNSSIDPPRFSCDGIGESRYISKDLCSINEPPRHSLDGINSRLLQDLRNSLQLLPTSTHELPRKSSDKRSYNNLFRPSTCPAHCTGKPQRPSNIVARLMGLDEMPERSSTGNSSKTAKSKPAPIKRNLFPGILQTNQQKKSLKSSAPAATEKKPPVLEKRAVNPPPNSPRAPLPNVNVTQRTSFQAFENFSKFKPPDDHSKKVQKEDVRQQQQQHSIGKQREVKLASSKLHQIAAQVPSSTSVKPDNQKLSIKPKNPKPRQEEVRSSRNNAGSQMRSSLLRPTIASSARKITRSPTPDSRNFAGSRLRRDKTESKVALLHVTFPTNKKLLGLIKGSEPKKSDATRDKQSSQGKQSEATCNLSPVSVLNTEHYDCEASSPAPSPPTRNHQKSITDIRIRTHRVTELGVGDDELWDEEACEHWIEMRTKCRGCIQKIGLNLERSILDDLIHETINITTM